MVNTITIIQRQVVIVRRKVKILLVSLLFFSVFSLSAKPQHIVSIHVCTDQLLMLLAKPGVIKSVSYFAVDADVSAMADKVGDIPLNHGQIEEILMLKPDLVLAGEFTSRTTVFLLKRLGFKVVVLPVATNFDDIRKNIMIVAEAIDEVSRGQAIIKQFNQRLQAAAVTVTEPRPIAVFYRKNSYTIGGNTLANTILEAAGFTNLAVTMGIKGFQHMPLETLITHQPDIIITSLGKFQQGLVSTAAFFHPAFKRLVSQKLKTSISDQFWICGSPYVVNAIDRLIAVRQHWYRQRQSASMISQ